MSCQFCNSSWLAITRLEMSKVYTYNGKILEGWERKRTENGVSYYMNHATERTQWDHPLLRAILEECSDYKTVKYTTYRMALKLRSVQRILKMHLVTTETLIKIFNRYALKPLISQETMTCDELEIFLCDVYNIASLEKTALTEAKIYAELSLNFLVNLFDANRSGSVNLFSVFVGLLVLSTGKLHEKYKYLFRLLANHNNCLPRKALTVLLLILAEIPEYLQEKVVFGKHLVEPAVNSCFNDDFGPLGVSEETFLSWLLREPQTVVWLSTFFRLVTAEMISHNVKCCVCKMYPIIGLRYRCLHCFSYDLCQHCFFTGQMNRNHKLKHPIQEYCMQATSSEDRRVLMKRISNKFKIKKNKQSYLPITPTEPISEVEVLENHHAMNKDAQMVSKVLQTDIVPGEEFLNCTIVNGIPVQAFLMSQQNELESVIVHLEQQHKVLQSELEQLQDITLTSSSSDDGQSTTSRQTSSNRQEILLDHDRQLELQLRRLKRILKSFKKMYKPSQNTATEPSTPTAIQSHNIPIEKPLYANIYTPTPTTFSHNFLSTSTPTYTAVEIHPAPQDNHPIFVTSPIGVGSPNATEDNTRIYANDATVIADSTNSNSVSDQQDYRNGSSISDSASGDSARPITVSYNSTFDFPEPENSHMLSSVQDELESIMQHLQESFPSNFSQINSDYKNDPNQLLRAAMDVGNILADFVDKVRVTDYKVSDPIPKKNVTSQGPFYSGPNVAKI